jgi:hypothetical protein
MCGLGNVKICGDGNGAVAKIFNKKGLTRIETNLALEGLGRVGIVSVV